MGARWGSVRRKNKPIPGRDLCPCEDQLLGWEGPDGADLPPSGWLGFSRNSAESGRALVSCWQIGRSEAAVARLVLVCGPMCSLGLCCCDQLHSYADCAGNKVAESFDQLSFQFLSVVDVLWCVLVCDTQIFILCAYCQMSSHVPIPQTLSPTF